MKVAIILIAFWFIKRTFFYLLDWIAYKREFKEQNNGISKAQYKKLEKPKFL